MFLLPFPHPIGLVVPPVHNVESLQLHEIEYKIKDSYQGKRWQFGIEEMKVEPFTITNGGVLFTVVEHTPIITNPNPPFWACMQPGKTGGS